MLRTMLFASLLILSAIGAVAAPSADDLRGTWAVEVEGRNLFVLKLESAAQGLSGTLQRPTVVAVSPSSRGVSYRSVKAPIYTSRVRQVRTTPDGVVLSYAPPGGEAKEFLLRPDGKDVARFVFDAADPDGPSAILTRASVSAAVAANWQEDKTYFVPAPEQASNPEIAGIFAADQADRQAGPGIDWALVGPRDEARRKRVREMLDGGLLHTADDYYSAAFVFQHGGKPEDYLLAHSLAMASMALGRSDASWIASATLDRFLQNIDRPQIFGTQYLTPRGGPVTQGKYDSALIPDSLRVVLGVPTRVQQESQRLEIKQRK
jgi:hypothetical protein